MWTEAGGRKAKHSLGSILVNICYEVTEIPAANASTFSSERRLLIRRFFAPLTHGISIRQLSFIVVPRTPHGFPSSGTAVPLVPPHATLCQMQLYSNTAFFESSMMRRCVRY